MKNNFTLAAAHHMSEEVIFKNNPLHGLSLVKLLNEIVDHYGFEILYAYLNINCFKTNPSIEFIEKFLKKLTEPEKSRRFLFVSI